MLLCTVLFSLILLKFVSEDALLPEFSFQVGVQIIAGFKDPLHVCAQAYIKDYLMCVLHGFLHGRLQNTV